MSAGEPLLRIEGVKCAYGQAEILHGVDLGTEVLG